MPVIFTLLTATYNRAGTIRDSVASLYDQVYGAWQHVVIDDGSTDDTVVVINTFPCARRILVSEPDQGIFFALNI